VARLGGVGQGVVHLSGEAPLAGGFIVETGCKAEVAAPVKQSRGGIRHREIGDPVPQHGSNGELGFSHHRLRIDGCVVPVDWLLRRARPGEDVEEVEVGVDQHISTGAPAHRAPGLAHLKRGLQEPAGERSSELLPFSGKVVAPLLCPGSDVPELPPLRLAVRNEAQLAHESAPHLGGSVHRHRLKRAAGLKAFQQHGAGSGVGREHPDGSVPIPQGQRMPFDEGFVMGKGYLQGRRNTRGQHRHNNSAVAAPGQGAGLKIQCEVPVLQTATDQPGK
jgi:hypothetical protein